MDKITIVLERGEGKDIWGIVSAEKAFTIAEVQESVEALTASFRDLIQDYIEHEGKDNPQWCNIDASALEFDYAYSVVGLFSEFDFLKISSVAKALGINASQLRQYASGIKDPSLAMAQRIEQGIHRLAQSMLKTQVSNISPTRVTTA